MARIAKATANIKPAAAKSSTAQPARKTAAKASEARLSELEARVAALEDRVTKSGRIAEPDARPARRPRTTRRTHEIDPGDAVPAGVAVQEPQPLDQEAETALEHLQHLGNR